MSNKVGEIYGSSVNGRPSIKIDSSNLDVTGDLLTKGIIKFSVTNNVLASEDPSGIIHRLDTLDNSINILDNSINTLTNSVNILDNSVNSLLTSNNDACFNNVDVSGTLNVQGEKVMTVPALDICGNDLSANTTYEITTGPPGSINNISFVKKQQAFITFSGTGKTFNWGSDDVPQNYTIGTGDGSTITIDQITRNGNATLQQSNLTYNPNGNNLGIFRIDVDGLYQMNAVWTFFYNMGGGELERAERMVTSEIRLNGSTLITGASFIERQDNTITRVTVTLCYVAMLTTGDQLSFYFDRSYSDDLTNNLKYRAAVDNMRGSILLVG